MTNGFSLQLADLTSSQHSFAFFLFILNSVPIEIIVEICRTLHNTLSHKILIRPSARQKSTLLCPRCETEAQRRRLCPAAPGSRRGPNAWLRILLFPQRHEVHQRAWWSSQTHHSRMFHSICGYLTTPSHSEKCQKIGQQSRQKSVCWWETDRCQEPRDIRSKVLFPLVSSAVVWALESCKNSQV